MRLSLYFQKFEEFFAIMKERIFQKIYNSARGLITFFFLDQRRSIFVRGNKLA